MFASTKLQVETVKKLNQARNDKIAMQPKIQSDFERVKSIFRFLIANIPAHTGGKRPAGSCISKSI